MTRLRKMMLEELERRNYSEATTRSYIRTVEDFSRRFKCSPDDLGPEHIREYQAELFKKRKLSPGTVTQRLAAPRFFYIKTLKKTWSIAETPYPKKAFHLPSILSREEVARLNFHGDLTLLAKPKTFAAWLRPLFRKDWVVYSKRPFGGPEHVLRYLGRYTHRVAISNHRLVSFADGKVTFRWRDSAHSNEQKLMTPSLDEFLRRFLLHLLPEGFVRIRNFGFLANRKRAIALPLSFQLLGGAPQTEQEASTAGPSDLWSCPKCGGPMMAVERLTASEIQLRSPPLVTAAA